MRRLNIYFNEPLRVARPATRAAMPPIAAGARAPSPCECAARRTCAAAPAGSAHPAPPHPWISYFFAKAPNLAVRTSTSAARPPRGAAAKHSRNLCCAANIRADMLLVVGAALLACASAYFSPNVVSIEVRRMSRWIFNLLRVCATSATSHTYSRAPQGYTKINACNESAVYLIQAASDYGIPVYVVDLHGRSDPPCCRPGSQRRAAASRWAMTMDTCLAPRLWKCTTRSCTRCCPRQSSKTFCRCSRRSLTTRCVAHIACVTHAAQWANWLSKQLPEQYLQELAGIAVHRHR